MMVDVGLKPKWEPIKLALRTSHGGRDPGGAFRGVRQTVPGVACKRRLAAANLLQITTSAELTKGRVTQRTYGDALSGGCGRPFRQKKTSAELTKGWVTWVFQSWMVW